MKRRDMRTLVLGIGNLLLRDEGVGVHVVQTLMREGYPEGVDVLDVGTAILDALPAIEEAGRIIIIDAVKADGAPGSIYRMPMDAFERPQCIASMHGFDLSRVLALAGRTDDPEVIVIGVEPARIEWGLELSPEVGAMLPFVIKILREELATSSNAGGLSTSLLREGSLSLKEGLE